ncbi:MAG: hypothetical protein JO273_11620 [Methylobacteriaceae bacterium]|nr:hypothetical protein [Methylobacteriaceae bacterium]
MFEHPAAEERLRRLQERLRRAPRVTPQLIERVLAEACPRLAALPSPDAAGRIRQLVDVGAWIEAAMAMIDLELPAWKVRQLTLDEGEWRCCLSQLWQLPDWLDDPIEAHNEALPIALLDALVEARCRLAVSAENGRTTVPSVRLQQGYSVCCDDFA